MILSKAKIVAGPIANIQNLGGCVILRMRERYCEKNSKDE